MEVFNHYAHYYDLIYSLKDYKEEADYVNSLIRNFAPKTTTILDLGCGTGSHDFYLARKGFDVTGVDLSESMIAIAKEKQTHEALENLKFLKGDITSLNLKKEFDCVVSLFHVMNYLTSNDAMNKGFTNAVKHLKSGGLFIFDCWYGPSVLNDLPQTRMKKFENDKIKVTRFVEPVIHFNENIVDVNYEIYIQEKQTSKVVAINETHSVRYFFNPELKVLFEKLNLRILLAEELITKRHPGKETFGVCFVTQKN